MKTLIHERVDSARSGTNPTVIGKMASGWAVLGDTQFLPGYCLLLPDPVVPSINSLGVEERAQFLKDMVAIGDALLEATAAYRINYESSVGRRRSPSSASGSRAPGGVRAVPRGLPATTNSPTPQVHAHIYHCVGLPPQRIWLRALRIQRTCTLAGRPMPL
jgi:hypothetical protein